MTETPHVTTNIDEQRFHAIENSFAKAQLLGLVHAVAQDSHLDGRIVTVAGQRMVNFGSCGYTALEKHPALVAAVAEAVHRYGTQFSTTRAYLSAPDYPAAEAALSTLFGRPTTIASSTSMANMAAITSVVSAKDVILIDAQAHRSMQIATTLARTQGTTVHVIPHSNLTALERRITECSGAHRRVWHFADGLYSMFGDFAPVRDLGRLVERYDSFWLFLDDAHSVSWTGRHGRGYALEQLSATALERTIVTASLNKSFGVAGGAMTFPDDRTRRQVSNHGWPMVFSGPVQPPMLAGILASARLHLSAEITERQQRLLGAIRLFNREAARQAIPLVIPSETPIRYIAAGNTDAAANLAHRLQKAGFLVSSAGYPAVPATRSGVRVALTLHQTESDITALIDAITEHLPQALAEEHSSAADVLRGFRREFTGREIRLPAVGAW